MYMCMHMCMYVTLYAALYRRATGTMSSFTDWMTTPDGVSRCRLAPVCDLVFTTPTGKGL